LCALLVQIGDGLHDLGTGVLPHAGAVVQYAVDGRLAQPGLLGDLANLVAVRHVAPLLSDRLAEIDEMARITRTFSPKCRFGR
jgi:hypothetical protein